MIRLNIIIVNVLRRNAKQFCRTIYRTHLHSYNIYVTLVQCVVIFQPLLSDYFPFDDKKICNNQFDML